MNTILGPIDDAVAWIITSLYNLLHPVFGVTSGTTWVLTILLLTVLMRLVLVPLFIKQMHTQRAMTALTPKLTELRKKYKGDREKLNSETMKLYQEAGVNPLMGCLPVVLQMPIFFALFSVLRYIAEWKGGATLYHLSTATIVSAQRAQIFGVTIKDTFLHAPSLHVHVVIALVVATSMLTTYLTMRQNVKRGIMPTGKDNPMGQSQRMMTYILPLFALTGLYWPFGLVLYWVSTNLWTLGQQFVLLRKYPVGAAVLGGAGLPIKGSAGRPATASGLTGSTSAKPKPKPKPKPGAGAPGAGAPGAGAPSAGAPSAGGKARPGRPAADSGAARPAGDADSTASAAPEKRQDAEAEAAAEAAAASGSGALEGAKDRAPEASGADSKANGAGTAPHVRRSSQPAPGAASGGAANGHKPADEGGVLRRFGRGRTEPAAPEPAEPEVKMVRQQRQRQSRSKRSGKR